MQTRRLTILSTIAGAALVFGMAPVALSGTNSTAPLPTCERSPKTVDQGDDVDIAGGDWSPNSSVTIAFDGDDDVATTDDTTDSTLDDDSTRTSSDDDLSDDSNDSTFAVSAEVDEDGEFETTLTIPELAARGSHSINVTGVDEDGSAASCARTVRLIDSPETSNGNTTPTTGDDNGGTTSTTHSTSSSSSTTSTSTP